MVRGLGGVDTPSPRSTDVFRDQPYVSWLPRYLCFGIPDERTGLIEDCSGVQIGFEGAGHGQVDGAQLGQAAP